MQRLLMLYKGAKIYCHFADFKKKFPATSARRPKEKKSTVGVASYVTHLLPFLCFNAKDLLISFKPRHLKYVRARGLRRLAQDTEIRTKCLGHGSKFPFGSVRTSNLYRLLTCLRILNSIVMLGPIGELYSQRL